MNLKFRQLPGTFAVCRLPADTPIAEWTASASFAASFVSITRTGDELSIVCPTGHVPQNAKCEAPWTCFQLEGPFPFAQTGVLASFIDPLAEKGVPIFALSTFDTDYVLVKEEFALSALQTLQAAGHELLS